MLEKIVVPLDGSTFGEQALPLAISLARREGIGIETIHVHQPMAPMYREPKPGFESALEMDSRNSGRAYMEGAVQRIQANANIPVKATYLDGAVSAAIQEHTAGRNVMIVMTTHGRGPLRRFWLGSVADQMLRQVSVPMLLLHPREEGIPNLKQDVILPRILIPLDGTIESEGILEPAITVGRLMHSEFTLLRVVEPLMVVGNDPMGYIVDVPNDPDLERRRSEAALYLDRVAERIRKLGCRVQSRVVSGYHPATNIVDDALSHAVNLIAMQTHGRQGMSRLLLGSVADKVLRSTTIPLLVHRPQA